MRGTIPFRRLAMVGLMVVASACSTNPAGPEATEETAANPDSSASEYAAWLAAVGAADIEGFSQAMEAAFADLRIPGQPRDGEPPTPQDIVDALVRIDWAETIGGGDAAEIATSFERATVSGGKTVLFGPSAATGQGALLVMGGARSAPVSLAFAVASADQVDTLAQGETTVSDGSKTGTVSVDATKTFDADSGRETIVWTTHIDVTDSATGNRTVADTRVEVTHDVCWGENGTRQAQVTTTTTVTTTTDEGTETVESSRTVEVRVSPDGSITYTVSATVDGVTVTISHDDSELTGPPTTEVGDDGETVTFTVKDGQKTTTISAGKDTWSADPDDFAEKRDQAKDAALDPDKNTNDAKILGEALRPPLLPGSPGGSEFCLRLSVTPSSAALQPDGETVTLNATVLDWNSRPVVSAVMTVSGAQLGSVDPQLGPTSTEGTWTTTYTSGKEGSETLTFEASHYGYTVNRTARMAIGSSTWALAMTLDIDDVTFLWDGVFSVDGGEIDGGGIGTVIGTAQCVWEGSSDNYTGPIARATGSFTFNTYGSGSLEDESGTVSLRVETWEGEAGLSYEDPRCGDLVEIVEDFLRTMPTITNEFPREFEIEIVDGLGTLIVPQDPYALEIKVSSLND